MRHALVAALICCSFVPPALAEEPAPTSDDAALVFVRVNHQGAEEWLRPRDGATVIRVEQGPFLRRPYEGWEAEEEPVEVTVGGFFVDRTEVTNAQFARFLAAHADAPELGRWVRSAVPGIAQVDGVWRAEDGLERHPVTAATGAGALAFAEWVGGRLPEPVEWEKAASGTDGRLFPWGDEMPDDGLANFGGAADGGVLPVGSFPRGTSPYGAVDMAGNAYERVWMRRDGREDQPVMIKGGSWVSLNGLNLRALDLCVQPMQVADRSVGFRCVMDDPDPERASRTAAETPKLVYARSFEEAVERARTERKPILLALFHETCGQSDRVRAQLFRDPEFVAYCNERAVVLAGHHKYHAAHLAVGSDKDAPSDDYGGLTWRQLGANYAAGLRVVGNFVTSPGLFVLHPDHTRPDAPAEAILVPERRLPKWGGDMDRFVTELEAARATIGGQDE